MFFCESVVYMSVLNYLEPGFNSSSYQHNVWKIVAMYRLYAVNGVDDALVHINTFNMLGTANTANSPHNLPAYKANKFLI